MSKRPAREDMAETGVRTGLSIFLGGGGLNGFSPAAATFEDEFSGNATSYAGKDVAKYVGEFDAPLDAALYCSYKIS